MTKLKNVLGFTVVALLAAGSAAYAADNEKKEAIPRKTREPIVRDAEFTRGCPFKQELPTEKITPDLLPRLLQEGIEEEYPGDKFDRAQEMAIWSGMLPPGTDLKKVMNSFLQAGVAGLYNPKAKRLYVQPMLAMILSSPAAFATLPKKDRDELRAVFVHEYVHALDDQYFDIDSPDKKKLDSDHKSALSFLAEGTATRTMEESKPCPIAQKDPEAFIREWKDMHSFCQEAQKDREQRASWRTSDLPTMVKDVPEVIGREELMPYAYGYTLVRELTSRWGADGLDYAYNNGPASTEQVIHPEKYLEWRDFPVAVALPKKLAVDGSGNEWTCVADDTLGEAGMISYFGPHLRDWQKAEREAEGWDGDHIALYHDHNGKHLLILATAWDSEAAARHFAAGYCRVQKNSFSATMDKASKGAAVLWTRPDGRVGRLARDGKHVVIIETDLPAYMANVWTAMPGITFTESPEEVKRAGQNNALLRLNPVISWRKDGDHTTTKALWGVLARHDSRLVGTEDSLLGGLLFRGCDSEHSARVSLLGGMLFSLKNENRRGMSEVGLLPFGLLWDHFSTNVPEKTSDRIVRNRVLFGFAGQSLCCPDGGDFRVLPAGALFRCDSRPASRTFRVLGTGTGTKADGTRQFRVFGIPVHSWKPAKAA